MASRLLPKASRPHVAAIYAFARIADDFADEGARTVQERFGLLDAWHRRLEQAVSGVVESTANREHDDVFVALAATIKHTGPGAAPLLADLLSAFRQDVTTTRYESWSALLDYCRRSANPVGRLVLLVSGQYSDSTAALADDVCTALQLTNFWQDFGDDWRRGRLYVPVDTLRAHGVVVADLDRGIMTRPWRAALADCERRTRDLYRSGRAVTSQVRGRVKWELRATWLGGVRILDRIVAADYDVLRTRPTLSRWDAPRLLFDVVRW